MTTATRKHQRAITNNSESPYAKLKSINFGECQWTNGFWAEKIQLAEQVMVVYSIEPPDLPTDSTILDVYIAGDTELEVNHRPDFLGGVTTIGANVLLRSDKGEGMYRLVKQPDWQSYQAPFRTLLCLEQSRHSGDDGVYARRLVSKTEPLFG